MFKDGVGSYCDYSDLYLTEHEESEDAGRAESAICEIRQEDYLSSQEKQRR